jgi:outer membrane receptor protein involved in Fe transport
MKWIKFTLFFFFIIGSVSGIQAQTRPQGAGTGSGAAADAKIGKISGKVVDLVSNQTIPYATIAVQRALPKSLALRVKEMQENPQSAQNIPQQARDRMLQMAAAAKDTSVVTGMIANDKGEFLLENIPTGFFKVRITFVGYKTVIRDSLLISPQNATINLGTIKLEEFGGRNVVTVTGEREQMEMQIDRKVFNVDNNLVAKSGSAEDVFKTIPTVDVDDEGTVSMRGNSNVTILIDGRPSNMGQMLEQIPASSIEKVEIITNPSARYESSGSGGIINIVLKKNKLFGYNGQASIGGGNGDKYNGGIGLNYRADKANYSFNYNYRKMAFVIGSTNFRENILNGTSTFFDQNSTSDRFFGSNSGNVGVDYAFNDKLLGNLSVGYNGRTSGGNSAILYKYLDSQQALLSQTNRNTTNDGDNGSLELNMGLQKKYSTPGREWTVDINTSNGDELSNSEYVQTSAFAGTTSLNQRTVNDFGSKVLSARTDYTHPINAKLQLETGWRTTFRSRDTDYLAQNLIGTAWTNDANLSNNFVYKELVNAAYVNAKGKINKFGYQLGLRGEQSNVDGNQVTTNQTFEKNYFNVFPNLALRYDFNLLNGINLNYSRRINRPRDRQLNPFTDFSDPLNTRTGNPNLDPEFVDSAELGYNYNLTKVFFTSSLFYTRTQGVIGSLINVDTNGISSTSYANLNQSQSYGWELITNYRPAKTANFTFNFNLYQNHLTGQYANGTAFDSKGTSWSTRLNGSFTFGNGWSAQLMANYMAPRVGGFGGMGTGGGGGGRGMGGGDMFSNTTARSTSSANYGVDGGLRKTVWNNKLDLNLRLSNLLDSRKMNSTSEGDTFKQTTTNKFDRRGVYLTLTYKFGKLTDTNRRKQNGENGGYDDYMF